MGYGKTIIVCIVLAVLLMFSDQGNTREKLTKKPSEMQILPTDLAVNSLSITNKKSGFIVPGEKLNFICTWQRTGFDPKKSYIVKVYVDSKLLSSKTSDTSRITDSLTFSWTTLKGEHTVTCEVDTEGNVAESDEKNNKMDIQVKTFQIKLDSTEKLEPDLIITKFYFVPSPLPDCERPTRMIVAIKNDSPVDCTTPFINAISIQGFLVAEIEIDSLAGGEEKTIQYDWFVVIKGAYIRIVTDFHDDVSESNEENNRLVTHVNCTE
jgi:subtilase family serine protease